MSPAPDRVEAARSKRLRIICAQFDDVFLTPHFRHLCSLESVGSGLTASLAMVVAFSLRKFSSFFSLSELVLFSRCSRFYHRKSWNYWSASALCPPCAYLEKLSKPSTVVSLSRLRHHNSDHMTSVQTAHLSSFYFHFLTLISPQVFPQEEPRFFICLNSDHMACFHRLTRGCLPISSSPCPLQLMTL